MSWKIIAYAPRSVIEGALVAHEDAFDWDPDIVLSGSEIAEDKPDDWQLEAWLAHEPGDAEKHAIAALFLGERLSPAAWAGVGMIAAGAILVALN